MVDIQPMNKEQEGPVALINADSNLAKKPKIKNNRMLPKGLCQLIANLNDKKKQHLNEIGLNGFLKLQTHTIQSKLTMW